MEAIMERAVRVGVTVRVAGKPLDPGQEINSGIFFKALMDGPPVSTRAFRTLVEGMHPLLARFIGRYTRDADQIQDVLQETFLAVHRALPRFQGKSKLTTWVYSLAYHKICDRLAEKYRTSKEVPESWEGWEPESREPGADERLHQARLLHWIREAAEEIPVLYREAYRMRDVEGLSGEEAAEALGISPALIRVRLHRARSLIVEKVRQRFPAAFAQGIPL
jgi:RNA polymerase sigma-70 factor (ECF subfamily)